MTTADPRPAPSPEVRIEEVGFETPDAQALVDEVQQEYVVRYGAPDATPLPPGVFDRPDGAFFVAYVDGVPVATGAWRRRTDVEAFGRSRPAEVKRMYVRAAYRRQGLARRVLAHLEETAREAGADLMVMETGPQQPEALALYPSAGYEPVAGFGYYKDHPEARYFGKPL